MKKEIDIGASAAPDFPITLPESGFVVSEKGKAEIPSREVIIYQRPTEEPSFANLKSFVELAALRGDNLFVNSSDEARKYSTIFVFTNKTFSEIGESVGVQRKNVTYKIKRYIQNLSNISTQLLGSHPAESFDFVKDAARQRRTEEGSKKRSRYIDEILSLTQKGANYSELLEAGFTQEQIVRARYNKRAKEQQIRVPYPKDQQLLKELQSKIHILKDPTSDPSERQEVLQAINRGLLNIFSKNRTSPDTPVAFLSDINRLAGIHSVGPRSKIPTLVALLNELGIQATFKELNIENHYPMRYGIIPICQREEAIELMKTHPAFEPFRRTSTNNKRARRTRNSNNSNSTPQDSSDLLSSEQE
jgi:predicted DNA-binding protein YlxM (UPF0122 family)